MVSLRFGATTQRLQPDADEAAEIGDDRSMRTVMLLLGLVALLASSTPYQAKGFRGGVSERYLGPGRWFVSVEVNAYTSRSTAMEYFHRRAYELCPAGYDMVDRDANTRYTNSGDKPEVSGVVECRR